MAKKDLKLNSLSRYSKQSSRLVLEEHDHCEVPAGCGGVVLRWRNPQETVPVQIWLHTNGKTDFFLDGRKTSASRPLMTYGEHILAFRISEIVSGQGLLMFAGIHDEKERRPVGVAGDRPEKFRVLSSPDNTWKYTLTEPAEDAWLRLEFDDSLWTPMVPRPLSEPGERDQGQYRFRKLVGLGAQGLGTRDTDTGSTVWVRKSFGLSQGD